MHTYKCYAPCRLLIYKFSAPQTFKSQQAKKKNIRSTNYINEKRWLIAKCVGSSVLSAHLSQSE